MKDIVFKHPYFSSCTPSSDVRDYFGIAKLIPFWFVDVVAEDVVTDPVELKLALELENTLADFASEDEEDIDVIIAF